MRDTTRRGSYAKGIAKREEILTEALAVIARTGVQGASVKAIAEAVELSPAGLLHYFESKEELFTEVLRKRDEMDSQRFSGLTYEELLATHGAPCADVPYDVETARKLFTELTAGNAKTPGLLHLFSQLAVDAADPEHPAHAFFTKRSELFHTMFAAIIAKHQEREGKAKLDPEVAARMLHALADGLQLQALLEPDLDMAKIADAFFELIL